MPSYKEFAPPIVIAHIVDAFWCFSVPQASSQTDSFVCHRVLPDGCIDLIFRFRHLTSGSEIDDPLLTVYGPTDRFQLVELKPSTEFVGVRFKPGEAGSYLELTPSTLFQQEVRAQDCSKRLINLFDKLCECSSAKQALKTLREAVLELAAVEPAYNPLRVREALRLLATCRGQRVSDVAATIGVNERTLRRNVIAAVGLSPKVLARILRFQRAIALLRAKEQPDLCTIALDSGYADQAHMGREFQAFSGISPTAFIR